MKEMKNMEHGEKLIPESDLMKTLGLQRPQLDRLRREKELPFVRFSSKCRAYLLSDILDWARNNRTVMGTGSVPEKGEE